MVIGAFGYANNQLDGQTIKTRNVYNLLCERYCGSVVKFDTQDFRRRPWTVFSWLKHIMTCKTLIILPCLNNLTYIFPPVYFLSKILRFDIVSICIGGWQVEYFAGGGKFKAHPFQMKYSKRIKAFLPEMEKVNRDLIEKLEFENTEVFPNFRKFELKEVNLESHAELKMVFMARINKQKGYPAIFEVLDILSEKKLPIGITFYGQVAEEDKEDFYDQLEKHKVVATYQGALKPDEIHETLANYDVMLLPTRYYTEGFPGSILDAYIAGIPVIVTEWKHSHEFVNEGKSGYIVPFEGGSRLMCERILELYNDRNKLDVMKEKAHDECLKYTEDAAWQVLSKYLYRTAVGGVILYYNSPQIDEVKTSYLSTYGRIQNAS